VAATQAPVLCKVLKFTPALSVPQMPLTVLTVLTMQVRPGRMR
jgi:hypothetical protein